MTSRRREPRRAIERKPKLTVFPHDHVVADANVFADFVVSRIIQGAFGERAEAAKRIVACCAVLMTSNALLNEIIPAANRRGVRLPPGSVKGIFDALEASGKLVNCRQSAIEAKPLPREVKRIVPPEDHHVVQLAAAASAKFVLTDDGGLQRRGQKRDVNQLVTIISVEQALRIPTPKTPCP